LVVKPEGKRLQGRWRRRWVDNLVTCRVVSTERVWIGEWIYWQLTHTWLGTTSNYSATAYLHTLQIMTTPAKPFPACSVFTSLTLATAYNSGVSSASRA
jgi:hypothetical protein